MNAVLKITGYFGRADKIFHLIVILILGIAGGYFYFDARYGDKFYPGVFIGAESVGGKTYEEVLAEFKKREGTLTENGLTIILEGKNGKRDIRMPMSAEGITPDIYVKYFSLANLEPVIDNAFDWGHSGSITKRLGNQLSLLFIKKEFALPVDAGTGAINSLLERELEDFLVQPVPAEFYINESGAAISRESEGEGISTADITAGIINALASLEIAPLNFKTAPKNSSVTADKLMPYLKLADNFSRETTLIFSYKNRRWKVAGKNFAPWLTVKADDKMGVDSHKLQAFLAKTVVPVINDPPLNGRFEIKDGKFVEIVAGKLGNVVDIKKTTERVEQIISVIAEHLTSVGRAHLAHSPRSALAAVIPTNLQDDMPVPETINIPIEITESAPMVTQETIDQYGIRELVGYARTNFTGGSSERQHNIEVGISKLTGLLIAPGEEFSTVKALGDINAENGFAKEYVIKENKTVKEYGGGLCQIATTLFRSALDAGLKITDRTNHRFVISYYGPGLDATIYGPEPDMRFINNTGNYLLLQGRALNNEVILEFYGQKDGRKVEISKPLLSSQKPVPETKNIKTPDLPVGTKKCSETPKGGVTADVTYKVTRKDGTSSVQDFHSVYEPWQKICLIGTGS